MAGDSSEQVTRLLGEIAEGSGRAAEELMPLVYGELRKLARDRLWRDRANHSLEATALVHEVYVRLVGDPDYSWANRAHFFATAAEANPENPVRGLPERVLPPVGTALSARSGLPTHLDNPAANSIE